MEEGAAGVFPPGPRPGRQAQLSVLPSLTLHLSPCSQVFLWAPWTWCWTPVPAWPLTGSCTRPKTRRSTGRWRVVGALDPEGCTGPALRGAGREGTQPKSLGWLLPPESPAVPLSTAQASVPLRKAAQLAPSPAVS